MHAYKVFKRDYDGCLKITPAIHTHGAFCLDRTLHAGRAIIRA